MEGKARQGISFAVKLGSSRFIDAIEGMLPCLPPRSPRPTDWNSRALMVPLDRTFDQATRNSVSGFNERDPCSRRGARPGLDGPLGRLTRLLPSQGARSRATQPAAHLFGAERENKGLGAVSHRDRRGETCLWATGVCDPRSMGPRDLGGESWGRRAEMRWGRKGWSRPAGRRFTKSRSP